jgi:hypothetical protein
MISFIGIYENNIDTDLDWSLSVGKTIKKIALDNKSILFLK